MTRLTTAALVAAIAAAPLHAQGHPGSHVRPHSHDSTAHAGLDSAQHAALHALLHGTWMGTLSSPQDAASPFELSVRDSVHAVVLRLATASAIKPGASTNLVALPGDTIRWTQDVSGKACQAVAIVSARSTTPTMRGTIACRDQEMKFTLQKKAE